MAMAMASVLVGVPMLVVVRSRATKEDETDRETRYGGTGARWEGAAGGEEFVRVKV